MICSFTANGEKNAETLWEKHVRIPVSPFFFAVFFFFFCFPIRYRISSVLYTLKKKPY